MKKIVVTLASTLAIAGTIMVNGDLFGASSSKEYRVVPLNVVNVDDLTETTLNEIMTGEHPELTIEFSEGSKFPISFFLQGSLLTLEDNVNPVQMVKVEQTFYARFKRGKLLLSTDLTDWKPFKKFVTGVVGVSLSLQDGEPSLEIGIEANTRD